MKFDFDIRHNGDVKKGDLLISEPFMGDPNFERTVILLCEHNEEGSFGFIINRPTTLSLQDVTDNELSGHENTLFLGGPVEQDTLHFIHRMPDKIEGSQTVLDNVYWAGNYEQLKILMANNQISKDDIRFFIGYSGWSEGQLKQELEAGAWIVARVHGDRLFDTDPDQLWRQILADMGGKYKMMSNYPTDPRLN